MTPHREPATPREIVDALLRYDADQTRAEAEAILFQLTQARADTRDQQQARRRALLREVPK